MAKLLHLHWPFNLNLAPLKADLKKEIVFEVQEGCDVGVEFWKVGLVQSSQPKLNELPDHRIGAAAWGKCPRIPVAVHFSARS